jgi:hypothetical protein
MRQREQRIGELIQRVGTKSKAFASPTIIVIGGYALRAHIQFSRFSRDCDFALPKRSRFAIDRIAQWFPDLSIETKEKFDGYGFLRIIKMFPSGMRRPSEKIKVSLDFMEGEVRGRKGDSVLIDDEFVENSIAALIPVGSSSIPVRVPSYEDYFILKLMSSRPSDIRDIAALVATKGTPDNDRLHKRIAATVNKPEQLVENTALVLKDLSDARFVDSWRGTFVTEQFTDADRKRITKEMKSFQEALRP